MAIQAQNRVKIGGYDHGANELRTAKIKKFFTVLPKAPIRRWQHRKTGRRKANSPNKKPANGRLAGFLSDGLSR
jgi:hypothetical protein